MIGALFVALYQIACLIGLIYHTNVILWTPYSPVILALFLAAPTVAGVEILEGKRKLDYSDHRVRQACTRLAVIQWRMGIAVAEAADVPQEPVVIRRMTVGAS
jgi:hypothetical protein